MTTEKTVEPDIGQIIKAAGGPSKLSELCGVTRQAIGFWKRVPSVHVLTVETATAGEHTRYEMRPDVFGAAPKVARAS